MLGQAWKKVSSEAHPAQAGGPYQTKASLDNQSLTRKENFGAIIFDDTSVLLRAF